MSTQSEMLPAMGECVVTWWQDPATRETVRRIDRADERIEVAQELAVEGWRNGWIGEGIMRIEASNGMVRYRLGAFDEKRQVWAAERIGPGVPS